MSNATTQIPSGAREEPRGSRDPLRSSLERSSFGRGRQVDAIYGKANLWRGQFVAKPSSQRSKFPAQPISRRGQVVRPKLDPSYL
jgi:hypothetical protein